MLTGFRRDEGGFVLVVVVLSLSFLLMLITGVMNYSLGSQNLSRRDQDWNAALAAAEAGVDDYLFRLNQVDAYWQYSVTNPPPDGNLAFEEWVNVPGDVSGAQFRYTITGTPDGTGNGTVQLVSTGRILGRDVRRSVEVSLRRRNFLDYLYFTDYETKDPAIYDTSTDDYTSAEAQTRCTFYYYGSSGSRRDIDNRSDFSGDSDGDVCTEISFSSFDEINGPLHSNDAIRVSGNPEFNGDTTTSYDGSLTGGQLWWGSGSPSFATAGDPQYATPLAMPPSNTLIKDETINTAAGGCLFTGPTAIRLNADGTMDVISPFTRWTTGTLNQNCNVTYTGAGTASNLYYTDNGFTITRMTQPTDGVIYVQNVPSDVADPNYTNGCPAAMTRARIGGGTGGNVTHPLGFPQQYDLTPVTTGTTPTGYGCRNGDVFLMGQLDGRLTIAADNNIIVFDDVTYESASDDLLGLVANNYVEVYHPTRNDGSPTNCHGSYQGPGSDEGCSLRRPTASSFATVSLFTGTTPGTSTMSTTTLGASTAFQNPEIDAAILTLQHSFRVQWYQYGDDDVLGDLNIMGAIAQKYRGIVGLINNTGYAKNYVYDSRLRYDSPPKFWDLTTAAWQVVVWAECRTAVCQPVAV